MAHKSVIIFHRGIRLSVPYVGATKHVEAHFVDYPDYPLDHQHPARSHEVVAP